MELKQAHKVLILTHGLALVGSVYKELVKDDDTVNALLEEKSLLMEARLHKFMKNMSDEFPFLNSREASEEFSLDALKFIFDEIDRELDTLGI